MDDVAGQILFASIQSVARDDGYSIGPRHVVLIDESHLVPSSGVGQYRTLLARLRERVPEMRVAGFTATPYRLDSGSLHGGKGGLFDDLVFTYGIGEGVRDGYLAPLTSRNGGMEIDVASVTRRGGEFVPGELQAAAMDVVGQSCRDAVERLKDRRSWLFFCAGVDHANAARDELGKLGIRAGCVTGETPAGDRDRMLRQFKAGELQCLTNANVLTTGFDAPCVDAVVMMRPTLSTSLYVQMLGRGTRLHPGKANCLVLDYAGNVRRHGPVDAIEVRGGKSGSSEKGEKTDVDAVRAKQCPDCESLQGLRTLSCTECGHEWPAPKPVIEIRPENRLAVMVGEMEKRWFPVSRVNVFRHDKPDGIASLRVEYACGMEVYKEWVTPDHLGYSGERGRQWWRAMTGLHRMSTTYDRVYHFCRLWPAACPSNVSIQVKRDGKFWRVMARRILRGGEMYEIDDALNVRLAGQQQEKAA